jgi:hypothetical protein
MNDSAQSPRPQESAVALLQRSDLPGLVARMLDDMVRIADARAKLFDADLTATLTYALDRAIGRAIAAIIWLFGGLCLLGAIVVLIHRSLLWWEVLAISGTLMIAAGWIVQKASVSWAAKQASALVRK